MTDATHDREYWVQRRMCPVCRAQLGTIVEARTHCEMTAEVVTEDGRTVHPGDRVFDYYTVAWGVIQNDVDDQGWFTLVHDDGSRSTLNGSRISTYEPDWMKR